MYVCVRDVSPSFCVSFCLLNVIFLGHSVLSPLSEPLSSPGFFENLCSSSVAYLLHGPPWAFSLIHSLVLTLSFPPCLWALNVSFPYLGTVTPFWVLPPPSP